ncbi:MAG: phytanoyl-CoA dioxygenase family protein [Hormoscilla sp. GM7CHS1pb]|nr:phytanoyl-CoA dioxygenase family protein [Hormoscilla sp. GM7CHS1pb]
MAIHTDSQPYGSEIFGMQSSAPRLVRVLYYLDDLTPQCAPLKVIPFSHLCLHSDANPYKRYESHPEELMLTCKAGSAVVINQKLFHGVFPNHSKNSRELFAVSYRPAWAGPIVDVPDNDPEKLAQLPDTVRPLFKSLNTRNIDFYAKNRTDNMPKEASGLSLSRWSM